MKPTARSIKLILTLLALFMGGLFSQPVPAADLPLAAASPLTGVAFDDKPLMLPVQRNFQMAMLTAGSELGRSCGRMEAYGWRMGQSEQARVNQIFNNTVDKLRLLGYNVQAENLSSVAKDVTIFTADAKSRHFMFLWSAGELGLVMNLCETSAPLLNRPSQQLTPSVQTFNVPADEVASARLEPAMSSKQLDNFSPVGKWIGSYVCAQGFTGGTLEIGKLKGQDFEGTFKFYPTAKNENVPEGSYAIYGQYDRDSKRILINPGKWIKRPPHYYNTVMVGGFDPAHGGFSAYFQGIAGCTSFEARRADEPYYLEEELWKKPGKKAVAPKKKVVKKKKTRAKKPVVSAPVATDSLPPVIEVTTPPPAAPLAPAATAAPAPLAAPAAVAPLPASDNPATAAPPAPPITPTAPAEPVSAAPAPSAPAPTDQGGILLAAPPGK